MTVANRLQAAVDAEGALLFLARYVRHARSGQGAAWCAQADVPTLQAEAEERWGEQAEILSWDVQRRERRRWRRLEFKVYLDDDKRWYGDAIALHRRAPGLAELLRVMHTQQWLEPFELYLYADGLDEGRSCSPPAASSTSSVRPAVCTGCWRCRRVRRCWGAGAGRAGGAQCHAAQP